MKTRVIYDIKATDYYLYCEFRLPQQEYLFICYYKEPGYIRYNLGTYTVLPDKELLIERTKTSPIKSKRPYRAGQGCDGSVYAPVMHLYYQLCTNYHIDPIALYQKAYQDHPITLSELQDTCAFALWQGVEIVKNWDEKTLERLLESLTAMNYHQLRSVLETHLNNISSSHQKQT